MTTQKRTITATVITLNEERNIEACIQSFYSIVDEIIVVDSGSTDRTQRLAESAGATVIEQPYLGDGPQKAVGAEFAKNDWILSIDADERLGEDAIREIGLLDLSDKNKAYAFWRKNFVGSHWIKAAGFYPDYVTRLYNRLTAAYSPNQAHAKVIGGKITRCNSYIEHYTYQDYTHWMTRINELSTRDAWSKYNEGQRSTPAGAVVRSGFAFFKKLFLKGGVMQGSDGWLIAITTAMHVYMKYLKLSELHDQRKDAEE